jgi:hypothetical protein
MIRNKKYSHVYEDWRRAETKYEKKKFTYNDKTAYYRVYNYHPRSIIFTDEYDKPLSKAVPTDTYIYIKREIMGMDPYIKNKEWYKVIEYIINLSDEEWDKINILIKLKAND